ncbi:hypothetical protein CsSME_00029855 [Camellia sinensis var. sinensis]|uniref:NAC domain-containing protein n=2 Tax=Camellia sinensis TaxID=4442 RepID=A0A7J7GVV1_CAMSI|nr:transcription factor JUNGBRUNNEN 1-like [Camellia sinensis]KAF5944889.1 hypothetical protein HYC85_018966 [Camellia sinensis]THG17469.1 hypothetical protein TEA_006859 [Camellia sinensis var. sinensis]
MSGLCNNSEEEDEEVLLPGFRFHPTDEELLGFYLRRKVENKPNTIELIKHIDICKYDPWDLPKAGIVGDKEWYFYSIRERKYRNSIRPNRVTASGFWKATGVDRPICSTSNPHECIGLKKALVFYRGRAGKGTKTEWMMHEFRLPTSNNTNLSKARNITKELEVWTICRVFTRSVSYRKYESDWRETPLKKSSMKCSIPKPCTSSKLDVSYKSRSIENSKEKQRNNQLVAGHLNFSNPNGNSISKDGNWDELQPILDFALHPHMVVGKDGRWN